IMINIVLFGPPGSGKGTQAQHLIEKYNLKQISTGDLFRFNMKNETELGKMAKSYIDQGHLVPDQVTTDMLIEELRKTTDTEGFIFDGYPRTTNQTEALEKIVKDQLDAEITVCLSLVVDDEVLVQRRSEEHTSELQSRENLVCRLLLEKKNKVVELIL